MTPAPDDRPVGRAVEIRPTQPVGVWSAKAPGGLQSMADRLRLQVDPAAGVARWTDERGSEVVMPLAAGSGVYGASGGDGRSLRRVVVVTAVQSALFHDPLTRRIVFVDGKGRSLASSVPMTVEGFDLLWPAGIFDPIRAAGIEVERLEVRNQHQVQRAFPGASRHWRLTTTPWNWLIYLSWVVVPAVVFVLLIGLGVID